MKKFRTLLGFTAIALLPLAAQAEMKAMSLDELAAVEAQGRYSLSAAASACSPSTPPCWPPHPPAAPTSS